MKSIKIIIEYKLSKMQLMLKQKKINNKNIYYITVLYVKQNSKTRYCPYTSTTGTLASYEHVKYNIFIY